MSIGLVVDIVLLAITIFVIIKFTVKGFFSSVLDVCKLGASVLVAFLVRVPVAKLFCALFMNKAMYKVVESSLNAFLSDDKLKITIDIASLLVEDKHTGFFEKFLPRYGLNYEKFITEFEQLKGAEDPGPLVHSLSENLGGAAAMIISIALALIVTFVISYIALIIVAKLLENLTKFEGVKQANRWLGLVVGVIISLLIMWGVSMGLLALVEFVGPLAPNVINSDLTEKSMIVGIFKNINLIDFIKNKIYK